jgi:hypothetical protein
LAWIAVESAEPDEESIAALDSARIDPDAVVVRSVRSGARLMIGVDVLALPSEIRIDVAGACPLTVSSSELIAAGVDHRRLAPRLTLRSPPHPRDLGYDAPFVLEAVPGCPEPAGVSVTWRQVAGPALRTSQTDASGRRFEGRTAAWADVGLEPPAHGLVPVSPRTSAAIAIEAEWRPARSAASVVRRRVQLASASRARGLPNVGVDEGVLLAGPGWSVSTAPHGAAATLQPSGALTRLVPDVAGPWLLRDAAGRALSLQAGRYDEVPLDCGRSGCHGAIADAVQDSPMTGALHKLIGDDRRGGVACALACHATGEPGTHDGGFTDVMTGFDADVGWSLLPRAGRRLGGVTCLGCHGPSAVPEPSARWAILRSDVCATCHDAPPTYGHVAAWRSSRMARSDADPQARADAACARCHTTSGFLASVRDGAGNRAPPPDVEPIGIACAACHAPHDEHSIRGAANGDHLLRDVALPESLGGASVPRPSRVCLGCHAPVASFAPGTRERTLSPAASAAVIWAGRGGIDPQTGAPLEAPSVHGSVDGGCIGCHSAGPSGLERGAGHAFRASMTTCTTCHTGEVPDSGAIEREIHEQAVAVLARLVAMTPSISTDRPRHTQGLTLADDRIGRATYDALLVLEDPAAAAHNAPFARALLEAAQRASGGVP